MRGPRRSNAQAAYRAPDAEAPRTARCGVLPVVWTVLLWCCAAVLLRYCARIAGLVPAFMPRLNEVAALSFVTVQRSLPFVWTATT